MAQMENELITINAPMAPVIDVVMPPLREGGVSMVAPEYDNSIANYYNSLRETISTSFAAFKSIIDTGNEKAKWDVKNKMTKEKAVRSFILNEGARLGLIPESFDSPTAKQFVDAVNKNKKTAKDDNLVLRKVEEEWDADANGNGIPDYLETSRSKPSQIDPRKLEQDRPYVVRTRTSDVMTHRIDPTIAPPINPWVLQGEIMSNIRGVVR